MPISERLYEILNQWLEDVESETPSEAVRNTGLCTYIADNGSDRIRYEFDDLRYADFPETFGHPFHVHMGAYFDDAGNHHKNEARRDWVRAKLTEYEESLK